MKKQSVFNGQQGDRTLKKKGFYVALAVCLIAIAVAVYLGVGGMMDSLNSSGNDANLSGLSDSSDIEQNSNPVEDVDKTQSGVVIDSSEDTSSEDIKVGDEKDEDDDKVQETVKNTSSDTSSQSPKAPAQKFMMPLEGDIINGYSNGELVKSKTLNEWRTHDGIDIKASANTPVKAISEGTIESIEEDPMWGVIVVISHANDYQSMYCGLKTSVPVKVGAEVKIGDVIGYVGNTAEIEILEESHLHLGVKKGDSWVDPKALF